MFQVPGSSAPNSCKSASNKKVKAKQSDSNNSAVKKVKTVQKKSDSSVVQELTARGDVTCGARPKVFDKKTKKVDKTQVKPSTQQRPGKKSKDGEKVSKKDEESGETAVEVEKSKVKKKTSQHLEEFISKELKKVFRVRACLSFKGYFSCSEIKSILCVAFVFPLSLIDLK